MYWATKLKMLGTAAIDHCTAFVSQKDVSQKPDYFVMNIFVKLNNAHTNRPI